MSSKIKLASVLEIIVKLDGIKPSMKKTEMMAGVESALEALKAMISSEAVGPDLKAVWNSMVGSEFKGKVVGTLPEAYWAALEAPVYNHEKHGNVWRVRFPRAFYLTHKDACTRAIGILQEGGRVTGRWAYAGIADKVGYLDISVHPMEKKQ